jgi:hypothetical protein
MGGMKNLTVNPGDYPNAEMFLDAQRVLSGQHVKSCEVARFNAMPVESIAGCIWPVQAPQCTCAERFSGIDAPHS